MTVSNYKGFLSFIWIIFLFFHIQAFPVASLEKEITIRNVCEETIEYTITLADGDSESIKKSIKYGSVDRFPGNKPMDIYFLREGEEISYRLEPGSSYTFRYNGDKKIELYQGSHGNPDVADLAPYVPTPMNVVEKMLEMAEVDKDDVLFDLGCGDGRIVITAAKKYGARGIGVDIDPRRIKESRANAKNAGVTSQVEFRVQDALKVDFSRATVVALYLLPESNAMLRPILEKQLKPGVMVVCHDFSIPGWEDREVDYASLVDDEGKDHSIFLYKK
jgi:SAM-dependent methyltransferase